MFQNINCPKSNKSRNRGRDDPYGIISVECQESCHNIFIWYKAHAKVDTFLLKFHLAFLCVITSCSNIELNTPKNKVFILSVFL